MKLEIERELLVVIITQLELWGAKKGKPRYEHAGICLNINRAGFAGSDALVREYCKDWPHFSGNERYPVRSPIADNAGRLTGAFKAYDTYRLWGNSKYGNMRRDLCRHIATKLREEYNIE